MVIDREDALLLSDDEVEDLIAEAASSLREATANLHVLTVVHDERNLHRKRGFVNESQYLAKVHGLDTKTARKIGHDGRTLAKHPHVAAAHATGRLDGNRLQLLLSVARGATADAFAEDEEVLLDKVAAAGTFKEAEEIVTNWRDAVTADGTPPPEDEDRVDLSKAFDTLLGQFRLTGENAEKFAEELDRLTDRVEKADKAAGVHRSLAARRADALALMAERSAHDRPLTRPLVVMTMTHQDWTSHRGATFIRTGFPASPQTVARNLCTSNLCRIVLDATGRVIDMGRDVRTNTDDQRLGRIVRDRTCVFGDCDVPAGDCHGHHYKTDWIKGGLTDLEDIASLCTGHHTLVHEGRWTLTHEPDGTWTATSPNGHKVTRPPPTQDGQLDI